MPDTLDIIEKGFSKAQAFVVLMTPDDEARLREHLLADDDPVDEKELTPQVRPNVLFEAGMAVGRHHDRTILVQLGQLRHVSDINGKFVIRMDDSFTKRQQLAILLRNCGCPVNTDNARWPKEGEFEDALQIELKPQKDSERTLLDGKEEEIARIKKSIERAKDLHDTIEHAKELYDLAQKTLKEAEAKTQKEANKIALKKLDSLEQYILKLLQIKDKLSLMELREILLQNYKDSDAGDAFNHLDYEGLIDVAKDTSDNEFVYLTPRGHELAKLID
jgi:hypothetical protein